MPSTGTSMSMRSLLGVVLLMSTALLAVHAYDFVPDYNNWIGCYSDNDNPEGIDLIRDLKLTGSSGETITSHRVRIQACCDRCKDEYNAVFCAMQDGLNCFCGDSFGNYEDVMFWAGAPREGTSALLSLRCDGSVACFDFNFGDGLCSGNKRCTLFKSCGGSFVNNVFVLNTDHVLPQNSTLPQQANLVSHLTANQKGSYPGMRELNARPIELLSVPSADGTCRVKTFHSHGLISGQMLTVYKASEYLSTGSKFSTSNVVDGEVFEVGSMSVDELEADILGSRVCLNDFIGGYIDTPRSNMIWYDVSQSRHMHAISACRSITCMPSWIAAYENDRYFNVMLFDGINDSIELSEYLSLTDGVTVVMVWRYLSVDEWQRIAPAKGTYEYENAVVTIRSGESGGTVTRIIEFAGINGTSAQLWYDGTQVNPAASLPSPSPSPFSLPSPSPIDSVDSDWHITTLTKSGSGLFTVEQDGGGRGAGLVTASESLHSIVVGAAGTPMMVAEIAVYNMAVDAGTVSTIEDRISCRYGVRLTGDDADTHPGSSACSRGLLGAETEPAHSCFEVRQANDAAGSGMHYINPSGKYRLKVECKMSELFFDGGWTVALRLQADVLTGREHIDHVGSSFDTSGTLTGFYKLSDVDMTSIAGGPKGAYLVICGTEIIQVRTTNENAWTSKGFNTILWQFDADMDGVFECNATGTRNVFEVPTSCNVDPDRRIRLAPVSQEDEDETGCAIGNTWGFSLFVYVREYPYPYEPRLQACGNGLLDAGTLETCDDGNNDDCDGCSSDCIIQDPIVCSATPTASSTFTPSQTPSKSNTRSSSSTLSPSRTRTSTRTSTKTRSPSRTETSTRSRTPTHTRTRTRSPTSSRSPSRTPSETPTVSLTASLTASSTETASNTASISSTHTETSTLSATHTETSTLSATRSETSTLSATRSMTSSLTSTVSATLSSTLSSTASVSVTSTTTSSVSASLTATASSSSSPTSSESATSSVTASASVTATSSVSTTSSETPSSSASLTATETVTRTTSRTVTSSTSATSSVTASSSVTATASSSATSSVSATSSTTATSSQSPTSSLTPTSSVSATSSQSETATETSSLTASLTASSTSTSTHSTSASSTESATHSITSTSTESASLSATETSSTSESTTSTATVSVTATRSVSVTSTETASETVSTTETSSVSVTRTSTTSETSTSTLSATHSVTVSPSLSVTSSSTSTLSATSSVSPTVSATVSVTPTNPLDRFEPEIVIRGDNPMTVVLGEPYVEAGFDVTDNVSPVEALLLTTDNTGVNTFLADTYSVTYTATDETGNVAVAVRTVVVQGTPCPTTTFRIVNFTLADPDDRDRRYSALDELTVCLSASVDAAARSPLLSKADVDGVVAFSQTIGSAYHGVWDDEGRCLRVVVTDPGAIVISPTVNIVFAIIGRATLQNHMYPAETCRFIFPLTSPRLGGSAGRLGPLILSATAADPDNLDGVYSPADTISIVFDIPTTRPALTSRQEILHVFRFTPSLPFGEMEGFWQSTTVAVLRVGDMGAILSNQTLREAVYTISEAVPRVWLNPLTPLRATDSSLLPPSQTSLEKAVNVTGTFGTLAGPAISAFSNSDVNTMTIRFAQATNRPAISVSTLSALLEFTPSLSSLGILSVEPLWTDRFSLSLRVRSVDTNAFIDPVISGLTVRLSPLFGLRNELGTSRISTAMSISLSSVSGKWLRNTSPVVVAVRAVDPDNGDARYGRGDCVMLQFDGATNRGAQVIIRTTPPVAATWISDIPGVSNRDIISLINPGNKPLLHFGANITVNATAANTTESSGLLWIDDVRALACILDPVAAGDVPVFGSNVTLRIVDSSIRDAVEVEERLHNFALETTLTGDWGRRAPPKLVSVRGQDPDDHDRVYSSNDTWVITFNEPTNQPDVSNKTAIDATFAFFKNVSGSSTAAVSTGAGGEMVVGPQAAGEVVVDERTVVVPIVIGTNYTGHWVDASTLELSILQAQNDSANYPDPGRVFVALRGTTLKTADEASLTPEDEITEVGLNASLRGTPPLSGSWGRLGPQIVNMSAVDKDRDRRMTNGDELVISFDLDTNMPNVTTPEQLRRVVRLPSLEGIPDLNLTAYWNSSRSLIVRLVVVNATRVSEALAQRNALLEVRLSESNGLSDASGEFNVTAGTGVDLQVEDVLVPVFPEFEDIIPAENTTSRCTRDFLGFMSCSWYYFFTVFVGLTVWVAVVYYRQLREATLIDYVIAEKEKESGLRAEKSITTSGKQLPYDFPILQQAYDDYRRSDRSLFSSRFGLVLEDKANGKQNATLEGRAERIVVSPTPRGSAPKLSKVFPAS